jgi:hypothetical protein
MNCCYDKGILCVYASSGGICLCSACINKDAIEQVLFVKEYIIMTEDDK